MILKKKNKNGILTNLYSSDPAEVRALCLQTDKWVSGGMDSVRQLELCCLPGNSRYDVFYWPVARQVLPLASMGLHVLRTSMDDMRERG